jgi:hypothetical protein
MTKQESPPLNRASKIRKTTVRASLRLLVVVVALASLGISLHDPQALSGGHSQAQTLALVDQAPKDGRDGATDERRRAGEQDCGPTVTCLPVLLPHGDMLHVLNLGPERDTDLPRLAVDLWQIRPTAPVPIV